MGSAVSSVVDTVTNIGESAVDVVSDIAKPVVDIATDVTGEAFKQTLLPTKRMLSDISDIRSITDIPKAAADIFVEGFSAPVAVPSKVLRGTTEKVLEGISENLGGDQSPLVSSLADIGYLLEEGAYEKSPVTEFFSGGRTPITEQYASVQPNILNRYNVAKQNINQTLFPYGNVNQTRGLLSQQDNIFQNFLQQRGLI